MSFFSVLRQSIAEYLSWSWNTNSGNNKDDVSHSNTEHSQHQNAKTEERKRLKRSSSLKKPFPFRKILFKRNGNCLWNEGVVVDSKVERNDLTCKIKDENSSNEFEIDFGDKEF